MKIHKKEIEFFASYVSEDPIRQNLQCLYLDLSTKKEGRAMLCATSGFVLGALEVELSESDTESYLIPFEHLQVAKHYLDKDLLYIEVERKGEEIIYSAPGAQIKINYSNDGIFPEYKKVIENKESEYTIQVDINLLTKVITSHKKLGAKYIYIKMKGEGQPIEFENFKENIESILMPVRINNADKLGKLQK